MGSLTKGIIGKEDISIQTNTAAAETFNRLASAGSTVSLTKFPDMWDGTGKLKPAVSITRNYLSYYASLSAAVAGVNALNEKTLYIDNGNTAISANLDLSSYTGVQFVFLGGSMLSPATGITITLPSPSNIIAPSNQQIFSGDGTIVFSTGGTVYPDWWGVDGTADNVQMQAAVDSLPATGGIVRLLGSYTNAVAVTLDDYIDLIGDGVYSTKISMSADVNCILTASYNRVANFSIDGNAQTIGTGVYVPVGEHDVTIDSLYIYDVGYHGIATSGSYNINMSNLRLEESGHRNINIGMDTGTATGSYDINIINVVAKNAGLANLIIAHKCRKVNVSNFISTTTSDPTSNGIWITHTVQDITLSNVISTGAVNHGLVLQSLSYEISVTNSIFASNGGNGVHIAAAESDDTPGSGDVSVISISNCMIYSNTLDGINITDGGVYISKNIIIANNVIYSNGAYGIDASDPDSTAIIINDNIFSTNSSGDVNDTTTNGLVYGRNTGWITQNFSVTAAIASGTAVNHGMDVTPTSVVASAAETGPTDIYVTEVGATSFKINFGGGGNKTFYWYART